MGVEVLPPMEQIVLLDLRWIYQEDNKFKETERGKRAIPDECRNAEQVQVPEWRTPGRLSMGE